jgi:hypothetical protein
VPETYVNVTPALLPPESIAQPYVDVVDRPSSSPS